MNGDAGYCRVCDKCGMRSPKTQTDYTLITTKSGWRMTRKKKEDNTYEVIWYCPECWLHVKPASAAEKDNVPHARNAVAGKPRR